MPSADPLRAQLTRLLEAADAHVSTEDAMAGLAPALCGKRPVGLPHSPWELLEHIRIAQHDILDFCRNPAYTQPTWPGDYWPPTATPPTADAWEKSIERLRADRDAMRAIVEDPSLDLFARIPHGDGQSYLREVLLVADHTSYHVGQLILVRQLLGDWPPAT